MFGALDDSAFYQAAGEMSIAVSANSVGRIERSMFIAIDRVRFACVIEADNISPTQDRPQRRQTSNLRHPATRAVRNADPARGFGSGSLRFT